MKIEVTEKNCVQIAHVTADEILISGRQAGGCLIMDGKNFYSRETALDALKEGNLKYINAERNGGDISPQIRLDTYNNGQKPYAVIITCSDSRVIPEDIFFAGIGELFNVRVAGNSAGASVLGSVEYAVAHLNTPLVVVMGHTRCGAVNSAVGGGAGGRVKMITDKIRQAIGSERDDYKACRLNVTANVNEIRRELCDYPETSVAGAVYHTDTGAVEFLDC